MPVRDAVPGDAAACSAIHAPYVTGTAATSELEPPTAEQTAERIAAAQRAHAWPVLTGSGVVVGHAHAGPYEGRAAHRRIGHGRGQWPDVPCTQRDLATCDAEPADPT